MIRELYVPRALPRPVPDVCFPCTRAHWFSRPFSASYRRLTASPDKGYRLAPASYLLPRLAIALFPSLPNRPSSAISHTISLL